MLLLDMILSSAAAVIEFRRTTRIRCLGLRTRLQCTCRPFNADYIESRVWVCVCVYYAVCPPHGRHRIHRVYVCVLLLTGAIVSTGVCVYCTADRAGVEHALPSKTGQVSTLMAKVAKKLYVVCTPYLCFASHRCSNTRMRFPVLSQCTV